MNHQTSPLFFVLGAPDHEMQEIRRICQAEGFAHAFATCNGSMVRSEEAYYATGVRGVIPPGSRIVFVECQVLGLRCDEVIDHHNPGDPGYGKSPEEFLEGSSLGQFLRRIGKEPTPLQRIIAAADHCLAAAYQGKCPGISPVELKAWREATRSTARAIPLPQLQSQIQEAALALQTAPRIRLADVDVAWFEEGAPPEASEASAQTGIPYAYVRKDANGAVKSGIRSAPAAAIQAWLERCGLKRTYGDPQRGFAGGYF